MSCVARSRSGLVANGAHPPLCMMAHARCGRIIRAPSGAAGSARGSTRGDGDETAHSWGGGWSAPEPPTNVGSVCGFEAGRTVWIPLLEASCDPAMARWPGAGGGEWLHRFVARACVFSGEFAPQLCRSLGPRAEETAANRDDRLRAKILIAGGPGGSDEDEDDARARRRAAALGDAALGDDEDHSESFSSAQATLLHLIREEVSVAPAINPDAGPDAGPESHLVLCEGTLSYLLDATSRAAGVVEAVASAKLVEESAEVNATAARCVLEECLGIWRVVTERRVEPRIVQTPGDVVSAACAMGLPRLLLALCAAMPPPTGAGQTSKASGPRGGAPAKRRARLPRRAGGRPPAVPSRAAVAGVPRGLHRAARQRHVRASVGVRPGGEARRRRDCPRGDSGRGRRRLPEGVGAVGSSQPVRRERRREGRDRADAAAGGGGLAAARGDGTERGG